MLSVAKTHISQIKPGMNLKRELVDENGRKLLPAGIKLTTSYITAIRNWGIEIVDIVEGVTEHPETTPPMRSDRKTTDIKSIIDKKFMNVDRHDPFIESLYSLATQRMERGREDNSPHLFTATPPSSVRQRQDHGATCSSIDQLLKSQITFLSLPGIYTKIINCMEDPMSSSSDIAKVISIDIGLSAKLLRLVNSALYGFPSSIDTISRAVTVIGFNQLSTLALGISVITAFRDISPQSIDMNGFWNHSLSVATLARSIGEHKGLSGERLFTAGMLHDIGRLVMFQQMPFQMEQAINLSIISGKSLYEAEIEINGFDHSKVGGALFKLWNIPKELTDIVRYHHTPLMAKNSPEETDILHLSDTIAVALDLGYSGSYFVPTVKAVKDKREWLKVKDLIRWLDKTENQVETIKTALK